MARNDVAGAWPARKALAAERARGGSMSLHRWSTAELWALERAFWARTRRAAKRYRRAMDALSAATADGGSTKRDVRRADDAARALGAAERA